MRCDFKIARNYEILYLFSIFWGLSSVGRASDLHSEGQEFDSPSLQILFLCAVIAQLVRARH